MRARTKTILGAALIGAAALGAYCNSLRVPFLFDDGPATTGNPSIGMFSRFWDALFPPAGTTVSGRPVANLTLAINHALSGDDVWSYHALNLLVHILGGLVLFGIVRRTLLRPALNPRFGQDAIPLALGIALLWTLHPLQTEAVTYVVQRVESLMGLFYLLTLYCFVRAVDSPRPLLWKTSTVVACLLGMGTKEVMVTAPVIVFLYDRTFVGGSFASAWRQRKGLYLALAATWIPLAFLVAGTGGRNGSAGFTEPISPGSYWLTQFEAVARYLWLSFWPSPQIFDYGAFTAGTTGGVIPYAVVVLLLAALTTVALWRSPVVGFLGAWLFVILAPTSLVPIVTQTVAEHRMYLPLAAISALVGGFLYVAAGRRSFFLLGAAAVTLGILTFNRNVTYGSEVSLWADTVAKQPGNARAHCSLGQALASVQGRMPDAISEYEAALRIRPDYADANADLGLALEGIAGRSDDAVLHLQEAVRIKPALAQNHFNLAAALAQSGRVSEATQEYRAALGINRDYVEACTNLGVLLCSEGMTTEGTQQLEEAIRIRPGYARAHFFLANALVQAGAITDAIPHYEEALRDEPGFAEASNNLGMILCRIGRTDEGMARIESAIRMRPDFAQAHFARGAALMQAGRRDEAVAEFETVLRLRPNDPSASRMLVLIRSVR